MTLDAELKRAAREYHMGVANRIAEIANPAFFYLVKRGFVPIIRDDGSLLLHELAVKPST